MEEMKNLIDIIVAANTVYYDGNPSMSDDEFDNHWNTLLALEVEHGALAESPTQKIDDGHNPLFTEVEHSVPMLSLNKVYSVELLEEWSKEFTGDFTIMPKYDGASLSLSYHQGRLQSAVTRGNGVKGDDITVNIMQLRVQGLPLTVADKWTGVVRGEVVMSKKDWLAYNEAHPEDQLKNARNGAAGTLRRKTLAKVRGRKLTFLPYGLLPDVDDTAGFLMNLGFVPSGWKEVKGVEDMLTVVADMMAEKATWPWDADGVVVRVTDPVIFNRAGATAHHPRGAMAFKTTGDVALAHLQEVVNEIGPGGTLSWVGVLQPAVMVGGVLVSRVSLHNKTKIEEKDIRIGDHIRITRAGDVIPHVLDVVTETRTGKEQAISIPSQCPSCKHTLSEYGERGILKCLNSRECPAQELGSLVIWAGRSGADIEGWGNVWINKLYEAGLLRSIEHFYTLDAESLRESGIKGIGSASKKKIGEQDRADLMETSSQNAKKVGLRRAIIGWNIPHASTGTALRLCACYQTITQLQQATHEELLAIRDIGEEVAASLVDFFAHPQTISMIKQLQAQGVILDRLEEDAPSVGGVLEGETIVLTGTLNMKRSSAADLLRKAGASVSGSVSTATTLVVAGPGAGSKQKKAEKLGIRIIDEQAMIELLEQ